jgi:hypothetical protein
MADKKISALTASTTPLAGTEVLPIVQSSTTKQVSVANLTAGRTVSATNVLLDASGTLYGANTSGSFYSAITPYDGTGGMTFLTGYSAGAMTFVTGGSTSAVLASTGDLTLSKGNLVIGTSGKGIDFSATSGAGTSELFNDYEEGACSLTLSSGLGTITSSSVTANYTKIGRVVTITGQLLIIDNGTGASFLNIIGLPFTPAAPAAGVGREGVNNGLTDVIYISNASTTCQMYTTVNGYPVATNSTVNFTMSYITS